MDKLTAGYSGFGCLGCVRVDNPWTVRTQKSIKKARLILSGFYRNLLILNEILGGVDGTRTRDPRRDRPVF